MELFGWVDRYSIKVHVGIGLAFLAFGLLFVGLMAFNVGKGGEGLLIFPLFAFVAGGIILWRAKDRVGRENG